MNLRLKFSSQKKVTEKKFCEKNDSFTAWIAYYMNVKLEDFLALQLASSMLAKS